MGLTTKTAIACINRCDALSPLELQDAGAHLDGGMLLHAAIALKVDAAQKKFLRAQMIMLLIKKYPTYRGALDANRYTPTDRALTLNDFPTVMQLLFATLSTLAIRNGLLKLGLQGKTTAQALLDFVKSAQYSYDAHIFLKEALRKELKSFLHLPEAETTPVVTLEIISISDGDLLNESSDGDDLQIEQKNIDEMTYDTLKHALNTSILRIKDLELQQQLGLLIPILDKIYKEVGESEALMKILAAASVLCKDLIKQNLAKEAIAQNFSSATIPAIHFLEGNDQNAWFGLRVWLMNFIHKICGHPEAGLSFSGDLSFKNINLIDAYKLSTCTQHIANTVHPNTQPTVSIFKTP